MQPFSTFPFIFFTFFSSSSSSSSSLSNTRGSNYKTLIIFFFFFLLYKKMEMEASTYLYGLPTSEFLHIDDLLDFSNDEIFDADTNTHLSIPDSAAGTRSSAGNGDDELYRSNFADELCVPSDDAAELEWLSKFMEDSFSEFPYSAGGTHFAGNTNFRPKPSVPGKARSKRSKAIVTNIWTVSEPSSSSTVSDIPAVSDKPKGGWKKKDGVASVSGEGGRKCTHCLTEKTPQWRTGPMGPKTLCNACGVRYKSGRLVPEYRPASSPTFVLTQHSNSHRKVMELRRQKGISRQENRPEFFHDF